jgi:hypothetical protein
LRRGARTASGSGATIRLGLAATMLACLLVPGCGYSTSLRVAERYPSVGLEIFGNDSPERDLERRFDDEMSRALRDLCDAPLVAPSHAEAVIKGKILSYNRRAGIRSPDNVLLETGVRIDVEASLYVHGSLEPQRTAKATSAVGYILDDQSTNNETVARDRALRHIAEELVLDLLAPPN